MEFNILRKLSQDLRIAPEFIVREFWEMTLLNELAQSKIGEFLVFKGGTALRLVYNSPRFSEDLDFDLTKTISFKDFNNVIVNFVKKYPNLKLKDIAKKYYTLIAQIIIKEDNLSRNFSVKIEISTRIIRKRNYSELKLITSPTTSLQSFITVAKLENIEKEKREALRGRKQP